MHSTISMVGAGACFVRCFGGALLVLVGALVSCGGGGSSDPASAQSNMNTSTYSVALDKQSIAVAYPVGAPSNAVVVTATGHGEAPTGIQFVYLHAVVEGQGVAPTVQRVITASAADLWLIWLTPQDLPRGTYIGRVVVYACADYQCLHPIGGTPSVVSYIVKVIGSTSF
jgi:hypothetical protein